MFGGLPVDEDLALGPNDFSPRGPYDFFGFGQQGPGHAFYPSPNQ